MASFGRYLSDLATIMKLARLPALVPFWKPRYSSPQPAVSSRSAS